ncbi:uncharacterized protein [Syngnathus scovelli]|uniref:uncharacterized protein isoform X2 n=1 Tax=Syngnathus scovelli TaxID=161590 RepID=UPI00210FB728|nr:serine/threonine-protein kinase DCLK3-like isoform X2 [Syngnathus scovelli]
MDKFGIFHFSPRDDYLENQENVLRNFQGKLRNGKCFKKTFDACEITSKVSELTEKTLELAPAQKTTRKVDTTPPNQKGKDTNKVVAAKASKQNANAKRDAGRWTQRLRGSTLPVKTDGTVGTLCTQPETPIREHECKAIKSPMKVTRTRIGSGLKQKTVTSPQRLKAKKSPVTAVQVKGIKKKTGIQSEAHTRKLRKVKIAEMPPKGRKLQSGSKQKTTTKQRVKAKKLPVKAGPAKEMTGTLQEPRPSQKKRKADTRQDATRKRQRLEKGTSRQSGASVKRERKGKGKAKAIPVSAKATKVKDEPNPEAFIRKQKIKDQVSVETVHKRGNNKQCATKPESLIGQREQTVPPRGRLGDKSSVVPAERESFLKPKTSFLDQVKSILLSATSRATFETKYEKFAKIGEGGFGSVYAGHRKTDSNPVAIKYIPKTKVKNVPLSINGKVQKVPLEAIFMLQASSIKNSDGKSAVISLLEICDLEKELVLIMERPVHSVALSTYLMRRTLGLLEEDEAKQLVDAAIKMHAANIFHRDLKQENILLEASPGVTRVRVIDFGCSCLVSMEPYHDYFGTLKYAPPEYTHKRPYCAGPTTVWHLGALLFELLDGTQRFDTCMFLSEGLKLNRDLSEDCGDFLWMCLSLDPTQRCTLEQMQWHPWLL